jgi:hypothetical protein
MWESVVTLLLPRPAFKRMSYGADIPGLAGLAGKYVVKILKGAKPSDLPVEQPVKFDLAINLKTARTLGLTIPPSIARRRRETVSFLKLFRMAHNRCHLVTTMERLDQ